MIPVVGTTPSVADGDPGSSVQATLQPRSIASLDGLRAVSIALVLYVHCARSASPSGAGPLFPELGTLGVRVFFVISGFLITSLLLGELRRTGKLSLRKFYYRRLLRIFPPYYFYLAAIFVLMSLGVVKLMDGDLGHALTYTVNYHRPRSWYVGHAWSLSVEEQFYLSWPAILAVAGPRRAGRLLVGYLVVAPLWRVLLPALIPGTAPAVGETFFTTGDSLAAGCLLALWRDDIGRWPAYSKWLLSPLSAILPLVLLVTDELHHWTKIYWLVGVTAENILIALIVDRAVRHPEFVTNRVLNWAPVRLVGVWSYSLYLWQQLFLDPEPHALIATFPANLLLTFGVAILSYYVIERPSLALRAAWEHRLFPRADLLVSPGNGTLGVKTGR